MSGGVTIVRGRVFDGTALKDSAEARFEDGVLTAIRAPSPHDPEGRVIDFGGDILAPGFVDLQVNGGDGIMLNDAPSVATLRRMAAAHARIGATAILPTLITDTPDQSRAAIDAARAAVAEQVPGILGLHLEGPHLSVARKGAHDASLIRPMTSEDLTLMIEAAQSLPVFMVTVAPENVTPGQVSALAEAGAIVALGHSDADFGTCMDYARAGAHVVTHLFNAMSQLGNRQPGLVGAALDSGLLSAGLIADGIHVHPATMRAAWAAKTGPGRIFLVSDAMAPAGSDITSFRLNGRVVNRAGGRLTLEDGTLAGADLDLGTAVRTLVEAVGVPLEQALRAATSGPAEIAGLTDGTGCLTPGTRPAMIRLSQDFEAATIEV